MDDWVLWLVAAGVLLVAEIFSLSFYLGPVGIAAVLAGIAGAAGGGIAVQLAVFGGASVGSVAVLRPIARRHLRTPSQLRTGTAGLVGEHGVVLTEVTRDGGLVKLAGEEWTARSFDGDDVFEAGTRVQVLQIEGATALVSETVA